MGYLPATDIASAELSLLGAGRSNNMQGKYMAESVHGLFRVALPQFFPNSFSDSNTYTFC